MDHTIGIQQIRGLGSASSVWLQDLGGVMTGEGRRAAAHGQTLAGVSQNDTLGSQHD
jgi:hypothetical protein